MTRRPLALALAVTLATRLVAAALVRVEPAWDGYFYARFAEAIASGAGYSAVDAGGAARPTAFYPVGYPAAMAALLPLTRDARLAAVGVNLLASLLAAAAVVTVARRAAGPRAATIAGLAYALYPGAILWSAAAMTETLTGALLALALAFGVSARGAVGAGLALGAATLVRPQSLLLTALAGLGPRTWRGRALAVAVATVAALAVVLPWTARNCARLDGCALVSTNGGSNLLIGTFADARGGYRRPTEADGCARVRGEVHRDRCMSQVAAARIRESPARWLLGGALKLAVTFLWEHDPVSYACGRRCERRPWPWPAMAAVALCTAAWWALVALAWRAAGRAASLGDGAVAAVRGAAGAFGVVALTHGVFLGADRYHLILVPLLCPAAGIALTAGRQRARDGAATAGAG